MTNSGRPLASDSFFMSASAVLKPNAGPISLPNDPVLEWLLQPLKRYPSGPLWQLYLE
jgi:hypothetical protein